MKNITKTFVISIVALVVTSCAPSPQTEIVSHQFVPEVLFPTALSVNSYETPDFWTFDSPQVQSTPAVFRCKLVDGKLYNIDHLVISGAVNWIGWSYVRAVGDNGYERRWPVVRKGYPSFSEYAASVSDYAQYYVPDRPLYWRFEDISIVSDNASFGTDYPIGSDLTPIVTFGFPSLLEFIRNEYKGPYTTEHLIRANDKEAWAKLSLFETGHPKLIIDKIPTEVVGDGLPSITIRLKFSNRIIELDNEPSEYPKEPGSDKKLNPHRDLSIKLLLDIKK